MVFTAPSGSLPSSADASSSSSAHSQPSSPPTVVSIKNAAYFVKRRRSQSLEPSPALPLRKLYSRLGVAVSFAAACVVFILCLTHDTPARYLSRYLARDEVNVWEILQPMVESGSTDDAKQTPEVWLRRHSVTNYDGPASAPGLRPKAALISLVRNEELDGILQSIRQLEYYFNRRHKYPWIFFSEAAFTDEFKAATANATSASTEYHLIPVAHWSTPPNISRPSYYDSLDYLGALGVGKGSLLSYRHMCRWNSLFFFQHPALASYTHYWRVEPDVHFFCHIPYDPFAFFAVNNLIYGFNMAILEDARSFPSLWRTTLSFIDQHPDLLHPDADISWLVDHDQGSIYNNCQFFSNFEIGDLRFFRSDAVGAYLTHLDNSGGFYYERFGDAPIHTLAVSLFAAPNQAWFFRDIGYQHDSTRHCPADQLGFASHRKQEHHQQQAGAGERCACEPTSLDQNFYSLVPMESPQRKPPDTCIRSWLGGQWLKKREGWKQDVEIALGGDGYGGYARG